MAELAKFRGNRSAPVNEMHGWAEFRVRFRLRRIPHSVQPLIDPCDFRGMGFDRELTQALTGTTERDETHIRRHIRDAVKRMRCARPLASAGLCWRSDLAVWTLLS